MTKKRLNMNQKKSRHSPEEKEISLLLKSGRYLTQIKGSLCSVLVPGQIPEPVIHHLHVLPKGWANTLR
jgi:hypothetical protein